MFAARLDVGKVIIVERNDESAISFDARDLLGENVEAPIGIRTLYEMNKLIDGLSWFRCYIFNDHNGKDGYDYCTPWFGAEDAPEYYKTAFESLIPEDGLDELIEKFQILRGVILRHAINYDNVFKLLAKAFPGWEYEES